MVDYRGKTVRVSFEDAAAYQGAVATACETPSRLTAKEKQHLNMLRYLLDAETLHLEQLEDQREIFRGCG